MTVPTKVVLDGRGLAIRMEPGPCLWCGLWVVSGREVAGATNPYDPCWHADGDFGCDESPETGEDGCGDHARPYDLAVRLLGLDGEAPELRRQLHNFREAMAWHAHLWGHSDKDRLSYRQLSEAEKAPWRRRAESQVAELLRNEAFRPLEERDA
ncbi:MAG: hypothetical protein ABFE07_28515 [Armatimonadia bacterium]